MGILINLIIAVLIFALALWVVDLMPLGDARIKQIVKVIVCVLGLVWLLQAFAFHAGGLYFH